VQSVKEEEETVRALVELGTDVHARTASGLTPLHWAAEKGHEEAVRVLVELGGDDVLAQDAPKNTPLYHAESHGHEAVVSFLRKNVKHKRRAKSTTALVVDPAALAAAEVAATAMAAFLIAADEEYQKQSAPSKQGSTKARKQRNRGKANPNELDTGSKGQDEAIRGSVASSSGMRDKAALRDDMGKDAERHNKSDREIVAHRGEENVGPASNKDEQHSHNEPEGIISRNVQRVEASSVNDREPGTSHGGVEQQSPTTTQTERRQQKERERKGKQRQRKRATTRATLEEALARVDTARASLDTLNALDAAIVSAKRILAHGVASTSADALEVPSSSSADLPELLRQAEERSLNTRLEVRATAKAAAYDQLEEGLVRSAVAKSSTHAQEQHPSSIEPPLSGMLSAAIGSAENENLCVVCLAAPKNSCKHLSMCAESTKEVFTSSKQPQCPVCRSRIVHCIYGFYL
jgi:hypothetical protein